MKNNNTYQSELSALVDFFEWKKVKKATAAFYDMDNIEGKYIPFFRMFFTLEDIGLISTLKLTWWWLGNLYNELLAMTWSEVKSAEIMDSFFKACAACTANWNPAFTARTEKIKSKK